MLGRDVEITWLGHSAFEYRSPEGVRILVDPFLSQNPSTPADRKHVEAADLIVITHGHGDHVGDAVEIATRLGTTVLGPVELMGWLEGQGVESAIGFNKGGTVEQHGIRFTMTNAVHTEGINTDGGIEYGGLCGYVIRFENGFCCYHAGDTAVHMDMQLVGDIYHPELSLLPIGDFYTMGPEQAAHAVRLTGSKHVLGMHYATFPPLVGRPAHLREELAKIGLGDVTVHELEPGETLR